ncbi:MarR family winged helix-turn-helix transcriptional regulator [Mangrovibacterium diazotrophicum]|uniref:MarR family transcriptional regulator n=1 Tax=Mangrovibacterium diazotrophicum TaxID=1261403 RepID=A0A419WAU8_9BACT|nr:MarR family transcriptional regulator [Mangrovibacterium diazotrophicum]RKD92600.1 MarR family transcriptional regulator [Mangrovibacterium diazotrophicum]
MDDPLHLKNQACFPVYNLSREISSRYRPFLDELGITYPQYLVLMVLWEADPQCVNEIGCKLHLDSGTLTPLLKRLQAKGFIIRTRKSCDERVVEINLTEAGRALKIEAASVPQKVMEAMNVTAEELSELKEVVLKILNKQSCNS